jgi:hypothetical protein
MSDKVVPFKPAPVKGKQKQKRTVDRDRYHCQGADCAQNDLFYLLLDSSVACGKCHSIISNLKTVENK